MIKRILFILVLCLLIGVPFVNGETLTGTLGGSYSVQNSYSNSATAGNGAGIDLYVKNIQYTAGTQSMVRFENTITSFTSGAPNGVSIPVTITTGAGGTGQVVTSSGAIGFQRYFNSVGVEQLGYQYVVMNDWNITGLSGDMLLYLNYNHTAFYEPTYMLQGTGAPTTGAPTGYMYFFGASERSGTYYLYRTPEFYAPYTATKPSGIGITGTVSKSYLGHTYNSQVFIVDGITNVPATSSTTKDAIPLNFSVINPSIKICVQDTTNTWWNTSTLFASTIPTTLPTPIPTPTGVGYGDDTTGTFYIKDGLNQTLLANAYVELHYDKGAGDMSIQGYTDGTGKIIFEGLDNGLDYDARIWKTGYSFGQYAFKATPVSFIKTFYIYPATTPTETIPTQINVSVRVMDKTLYSPISGAYVMAQNTLTGASTTTLTTNATGYVTFMGFPNSAYIGGTITKTGYVYQNWNIPYQASTGSYMPDGDVVYTVELTPASAVTPTGTIIIPTPTPVTIDKLILTATPDSINLGSSVSLTGSSSNATRLTYAGGLRRTSFYVNIHPSTYPFDYNMIGQFENVNATYWKFRTNTGASWDAPTTASPLTMINSPSSNGLITYSFNAYDITGNAIAQAGTDDVLVGGGAGTGSLTVKLSAFDATNNGQLLDIQMNLTDEASLTVTEFGTVAYDKEVTLPRGNGYVVRVTKTGYITSSVIGESGTLLFVVPTSQNIQKGDFGAIFRVPMFPEGTVVAGNTSVSSRVYDIETYYPLSNVQVVNSYEPSNVQYTGDDGESVSWTIPHNTAYTLTASKSGYCSATVYRNTSTDSSQWVPLYIKYGSCSGATPTPTPTGTPTTTVTPIGGWGNKTGEAIVCGVLPDDATFVDVLKNSLACNGFEDTESQNIGIALLIILFCGIILGRVAKGVGVLAGVIAGTVVSMAMGFLPFWIIIVVIIIAGLVFAGKVFWSSDK